MTRPFTASDITSSDSRAKSPVLLAVLGAVQIGHRSLDDIIGAARRVAGHDCQPTGDVIVACVSDAVRAGLVEPILGDCRTGPVGFGITEAGSTWLGDALCSSANWSGGQDRLGAAMRTCFLGALAPHARRRCVEGLRHRYQSQLTELRQECLRCPCRDRFVRLWMEHEVGRLEWELAWLDRVETEADQESVVA